MTELQEARLLGRAIRSRWAIPDSEKANVMESLFQLASNGSEESTRIAAARAIIAAESQNQKDELADADALRGKLLELATQLGTRFVTDGEIGTGASCDRPAITGDNRQ